MTGSVASLSTEAPRPRGPGAHVQRTYVCVRLTDGGSFVRLEAGKCIGEGRVCVWGGGGGGLPSATGSSAEV